MPYVSNKQQIKREPKIAAARVELASFYRGVRKADPRLARLHHQRMRKAGDALIDHVFYSRSADQVGGLQELFNEPA